MILYNFSEYVQRRQEKQAAHAVALAVAEVNQPGAVIELKQKVAAWFALHQEVLRQVNET